MEITGAACNNIGRFHTQWNDFWARSYFAIQFEKIPLNIHAKFNGKNADRKGTLLSIFIFELLYNG